MAAGTVPIRVLTVADRAVMRIGLQAVLRDQPGIEVVGEAQSIEDAARAAKACQADVALVALCNPMGIDLSAFPAAQRAGRGCRVILIAPHADPETMMHLVLGTRGAVGYLIEDVEPQALVDAVRSVHEGGSPMDSQVASVITGYLRDRAVVSEDFWPPLSINDLEILKRIVRGQTNRQIGRFLDVDDNTVKTRVSRILRKIGAKNRAAAAAWWGRYQQLVEAGS